MLFSSDYFRVAHFIRIYFCIQRLVSQWRMLADEGYDWNPSRLLLLQIQSQLEYKNQFEFDVELPNDSICNTLPPMIQYRYTERFSNPIFRL